MFLRDDTYRYKVEAEIERLNYLISAAENCVSTTFSILDKDKKIIYENVGVLQGYNEEEDFIIEIEADTQITKKDLQIKIEFKNFGIDHISYCFVRDIRNNKNKTYINISPPFEMVRIQRRTSPRISLTDSTKVYLEFNDGLKNNVINISEGGLAFLCNKKIEDKKTENVKIKFPFRINNEFNVEVKIVHVKTIDKKLVPKGILVSNPSEDWLQVGIQFVNPNQNFLEMLKMTMQKAFVQGL